jgi:ribosomal protein S18 acetylase RimI-like enzyme
VPALVSLINAAFAVERFFKVSERTDDADVSEHLQTGRFLLLEIEDVLAGSVYLEVRGEAGERSGYLGMLAVAPRMQKRGIGTRLTLAGEEFFRERGCHRVEITVVDLRQELPEIYSKLGYVLTGTAPFPADTPVTQQCSFLVMSKELDVSI